MELRSLVAPFAAVLLTGCALSTPTSKPNQATAEIITDRDYHVIVTHATIADGFSDRRKFFDLTEQVENSLQSTPGIVNFSKRANLFFQRGLDINGLGNPEAIAAFKGNQPHQNAISNAGQVLAEARFARFVVKGADLPVSWDFALEQLEHRTRSCPAIWGIISVIHEPETDR